MLCRHVIFCFKPKFYFICLLFEVDELVQIFMLIQMVLLIFFLMNYPKFIQSISYIFTALSWASDAIKINTIRYFKIILFGLYIEKLYTELLIKKE